MSQRLLETLAQMRVVDVVDILVVAFVFYEVMLYFRNTRATQLIRGLLLLAVASWVSRVADMYALNWLLEWVTVPGVIALIIIFQPELRMALERLGRGRMFGTGRQSQAGVAKTIREVVRAARQMSQQRIGGLIVLERALGLDDVARTGQELDAIVSAELLVSLFFPNNPLHDGAAIVRGDRVIGAACLLPMSDNPLLSKSVGTRHRAALGLSERSDAACIAISEETGALSLALESAIERDLSAELLRQKLLEVFEMESDEPGRQLLERLKRSAGLGRRG